MSSCIYGIRSKAHANRIMYVGKCLARPLIGRIKEQKYHALVRKDRSRICVAIRKYGWDNFSYEPIEILSDDNMILCERERYHIASLGTFTSGYNMTLGGDGKSTVKVACYDDSGALLETYDSVQEAATKNDVRECNISQHVNGTRDRRVDGKRYKYFKEMPIRQIEKYIHKAAKRVEQYDVSGNLVAIFDSVREAILAIGPSVGNAVRKETMLYGYLWKYQGEQHPHL